MIALIQAGGAGTRLKSITGDLPKPMVPIAGKPILQWQIESLARSGVESVYIVCPKSSTAIQDYFGNGSAFGVHIRYLVEEMPLGSGGAMALVANMFDEDFLLLFGDLMLDVDFKRFFQFHKKNHAVITAFAHPNSHPYDSDLFVCDIEDRILTILSKKEPRDFYYDNVTNAGLYVVSRQLIRTFKGVAPMKLDFEKDILAPTIGSGGAYAYRSSEYVKDCGTPDRYESVGRDVVNGVVSARNLSNKQKAIFLDRDGVINVFGDFVRKAEQLDLKDDAAPSIHRINESEYLAICITNQPVVARGETTEAELLEIHYRMKDLLGEQGAYLNDLYYCPHHPDKGFEGEVPELKIDCDCRKPKIGMLLKAAERYNIDLSSSWFVGDTCQDVQTGINAGCKTILILTGDPEPYKKYGDAKADYTVESLKDAVDIILGTN